LNDGIHIQYHYAISFINVYKLNLFIALTSAIQTFLCGPIVTWSKVKGKVLSRQWAADTAQLHEHWQ